MRRQNYSRKIFCYLCKSLNRTKIEIIKIIETKRPQTISYIQNKIDDFGMQKILK